MATRVDDALAEVQKELDTFAPELEGLADFERLNLMPAAREYVSARRSVYEHRITLLDIVKTALLALKKDGHPGLPVIGISVPAFQDLLDNAATIEAALKKFSPTGLASLGLEAGAVFKK